MQIHFSLINRAAGGNNAASTQGDPGDGVTQVTVSYDSTRNDSSVVKAAFAAFCAAVAD